MRVLHQSLVLAVATACMLAALVLSPQAPRHSTPPLRTGARAPSRSKGCGVVPRKPAVVLPSLHTLRTTTSSASERATWSLSTSSSTTSSSTSLSSHRSVSVRSTTTEAPEAPSAAPKDFVGRVPYETFLRSTWFGQKEAFNVPNLDTITEGKTTRLVKETVTGNILLGYKEQVEVVFSGDLNLDSSVVVSKGSVVDQVATDSDVNLMPGDVLLEVTTGDKTVDVTEKSLEEVKSLLAEGPDRVVVQRELFKPAWLEPKVWGDEAERRRVYFAEKKYDTMRKARLKNFRSTPGLKTSDVTIFERGQTEQGLGRFKNFFARNELKGEGSFGQVFTGQLSRQGEDPLPIILKRSKDNIIGAQEMLELELVLNEEIRSRTPDVVSPFLGYLDVSEEEEGQIYDGYLSTGLWLLWKDVGARTIDSHLAETSGEDGYTPDILKSLGVMSSIDAVKKLAQNLFEALKVFHDSGLVHRDIKPENLLLLKDGSVRFIDVGASASCLGKIISYEVGVGPQDPAYSPPDDSVLLPEGTTKPQPSNLETLWKDYQPSKFDVYSAGTTILQMACPSLRSRDQLVAFQQALSQSGYDLAKVRRERGLKSSILDANGGQGWDLIQQTLSADRKNRPSAGEVLEHPFLQGS